MSQWAPFRLTKRLRSSGSIIPASGWERLALLLVVAIFLTLWVATGNVDANMLFQSPQSPPVQPAAEQPPVAQPPVEQPPAQQPPPAEQPPAEQPPAEQAPVEQPPAEQPPAEQAPVEQPPAEQPPAEPAPAEQSPPEQPASDIAPPAAEPAAPTAPPEQPVPQPISREREEAPLNEEEGSSNFILDQVELIDTVVVSGAYIWLCCGVGLFLFVPLLLLFVYIRGRSKIIQEQNF